ncbi:hypothetical protein PI95_020695 [Hassallia byssoidea VB512170]|uniref:Uncharacterized protein n=1 Tax=Hassallia byssoidea VB512170 TaxID=1304833 RepID=A0A846HBD8_9CYAN|nr:hypothetical protein [Hassalia byssoidea]NEU74907.1 hypothetical protein [Hassalia byssoidea VB512170]
MSRNWELGIGLAVRCGETSAALLVSKSAGSGEPVRGASLKEKGGHERYLHLPSLGIGNWALGIKH